MKKLKYLNTFEDHANIYSYDWEKLGDIIVSIIDEQDKQHELSSDDIVDVCTETMREKGNITRGDLIDDLDYLYMHRYVYERRPEAEVIDRALTIAQQRNLNLPQSLFN